MPCTVGQQIKILFRKNFLLMRKTHDILKSLIFPSLTFLILYLAKSKKDEDLHIIAQFFVQISLMGVTRQVVFSLVEEKSTKQKEIQKIMGVKQTSYVSAWLLTNLFKTAIVVLVFLAFSIISNVLETDQVTKTQLVFAYILFGLAQMAQSYFISVFFTVPKTAGDVAVMLNIIGTFFSQIIINIFVENLWVMYLMALFPSTCFTSMIFAPLASLAGIVFQPYAVIGMLVFDTVLYLLLYLYFDQVLPNEYGTHKSPLFFLKCRKQVRQVGYQDNEMRLEISLPIQAHHDQAEVYEDVSSAILHQSIPNSKDTIVYLLNKLKRSVEIDSLSKDFGDVKAVNNLTLQIYESQILCFLGHNGAGKTSTISLLTGLITKDGGQVRYYGKSIDTDLDDIRQMTGICLQKDVLYDELTVEEHLRYYAEMKGFRGRDLEDEVQYILDRCVLQEEKNKLSKELSGGNKRKLSLGMALIGKSKIVFLDEPTSGMDSDARRAIWDILLDMKKEKRTVILTTHHLDEAEVLSERIAIMAHGKLLTVGSADFIKKNFGMGYHLNIFRKQSNFSPSQNWQEKKEQIKTYILGQIKGSQYNPQTAEDTMTFLLPFKSKHNYLPLFKRLEGDNSIQIDLAMTSLEEAFINIGMDQEKFMNSIRRNHVQEAQESDDTSMDFQDFSQIPIPQCLNNKPVYSFMNQFKACFLRKYYTTKLGKKLIFQIIVPLYFEVISVLICYIEYSSSKPQDFFNSEGIIYFTLYLSFGMCMSSANYAVYTIEEREDQLKYALNVMGCRILPYWLATMAFDCLVSFSLIIIFIILLASCQFFVLITPQLCAIYFSAQFALIGVSYAMSWLYSKANLAYKTLFLVMIAVFLIFPMILMIEVEQPLLLFFCALISPIMAMVQSIAVYSSIQGIKAFNSHYPYIALLIVQGLAGLIFSLYIDSRPQKKKNAANVGSQIVKQIDEKDVITEAERVCSEDCNDSVKTQNLTKIFSNGYSAVKGTSFGIDKGQVFGLLGPNGAGKSTTFNMITSRYRPSNGNVYLLDQVAEKGNEKLFQNVGICPQADCIWETMTTEEHLKIFAMIKGLKGSDVMDSVNYFIRIMQLDIYRNKKAGNLSGGNKRKLCVALALIGNPCLQFFDEPSSGLDPIARRILWNAIQQGLRINSSAVLLTTHSMDEAESLCNKIGIQVNGQFVCMGSPQDLKRKYGTGYLITLNVIKSKADIALMVCQRFPNCKESPTTSEAILQFQFPSNNFSFFDTFDYFLETLQTERKAISDFQIVQGTLEQVFMKFANPQEIRPEDAFIPQTKGLFSACMSNDEDD